MDSFPERIPDDLAASLPPERDDEPSSLRQDILDELRDHLECAVRREQCRQPADDLAIWQRVVARFGDPRAMARKLYWQALWSRVMQQRMIMAGGVGGLILGAAMVAMMGLMLARQQDLVERQLAAAERQQTAMEAMVAKLTANSNNLATLKVRTDQPARMVLSGGALKVPASMPQAKKETDFGELAPGVYQVQITSSEGWVQDRPVVLRSGETRVEEVTTPLVEYSDVTVTTNLPDRSFHTLELNVMSRSRVDIQEDHWWRPRRHSTHNFCNTASFRTSLIGKAQLKLVFYDDRIRAWLLPWDDQSSLPGAPLPENLPDKNTRIVDVELKAGTNSLHIEVPSEWIDRLQRLADLAASRIASAGIREALHKILESGLRNATANDPVSKKHIAASVIAEQVEWQIKLATEQIVRDAISSSMGYQLISPDILKQQPPPTDRESRGRLIAFLEQRNEPVDYVLRAAITVDNEITIDLFNVDTGQVTRSQAVQFVKSTTED